MIVHVMFVCMFLDGRVAPPCEKSGNYDSSAKCLDMIRVMNKNSHNGNARFADGSAGPADRDTVLVCMTEKIKPGTVPVWSFDR